MIFLRVVFLFFSVICAFQSAHSQSKKVIEFKDSVFTSCNKPARIAGHTLTLVGTTPGGYCEWGYAEGGLGLWPAALKVELDPKKKIQKITIQYLGDCQSCIPGISTLGKNRRKLECFNEKNWQEGAPYVLDENMKDIGSFTLEGSEAIITKIEIQYFKK